MIWMIERKWNDEKKWVPLLFHFSRSMARARIKSYRTDAYAKYRIRRWAREESK